MPQRGSNAFFGSVDAANARADRSRLEQAIVRAGGRVVGDQYQCPFHDDRSPSGSIHHDAGAWRATCHTCGRDASGDVFDITKRWKGCNDKDAYELVCGVRHFHSPSSTPRGVRDVADSAGGNLDQAVDAAHRRLVASVDLLGHLAHTRGIGLDVVGRYKLGIDGHAGNRYWTMPVFDDSGAVVAIRKHAADKQRPKAMWSPAGAKRDHAYPIGIQDDGEFVMLCPGELKALAVIALGLSAVGISTGEGQALSAKTVEVLRGIDKPIAVVCDDDEVGRRWGRDVSEQLIEAGLAAGIFNPGLCKSTGIKDIGDWIVDQLYDAGVASDGVARKLRDEWERQDPFHCPSLGELFQSEAFWAPPMYIPSGIKCLDDALGGGLRCSGIHLFCGSPGSGKTQTVMQIANGVAAQGYRVGVFSLELKIIEMSQLAFCQVAGLPRRLLECGIDDADAREIRERYAQEMESRGVDFCDYSHPLLRDPTRHRIEALIRNRVKSRGWQMVIIDYTGRIQSADEDGDNQYRTDWQNSLTLDKLAKDLNIAIVAAAGLRKSGNRRQDREQVKTLDDVAGAGRIAYDALSVWFVRSEDADRSKSQRTLYLKNLKTRYSAGVVGGELALRWDAGWGRVSDQDIVLPAQDEGDVEICDK